MNILEIAVIGSKESKKEQLYALLGDTPIRNFQGLNFGALALPDNIQIYFYFLDQEDNNYTYIWDLVFPHAYCCLILVEWDKEELFGETIKLIEQLEQTYQTPLHICSFKPEKNMNPLLLDHAYIFNGNRKFIFFDPADKESAKKVLKTLLVSDD